MPKGGDYQIVLVFRDAPRAAVERTFEDCIRNGDFPADFRESKLEVLSETEDDKYTY